MRGSHFGPKVFIQTSDKISMENTPQPVSYKIEYWALGKLNTLIQRYNKRSAKLGMKPLVFTVEVISDRRLKPEFQSMWLGPGSACDEMFEPYKYIKVQFEGNPTKINGWEFIGTIQHEDSGNILRSVPGKDLPESLRQTKPHCEHCTKYRSRKDTYVLKQDETPVYKQIGANCLRDFLGHDPSMALSLLDMIRDLDNEEDSGVRRQLMATTNELICMAAAVALKVGFSKDSARWAWTYLFPDKDHSELVRKGKLPNITVDDEARSLAERALLWLETAEVNGFISNLKAVAGMQYITKREATLTAWIVGAYLKAEEQDKLAQTKAQIRREQQLKEKEILGNSKHIASIGQRLEKDVTLLQSREMGIGFDGQVLHLYKFLSVNGEVITWFTSTRLGLNAGDSIRIKFTVKKHTEYNGVPETQVSRVKEVQKQAEAG